MLHHTWPSRVDPRAYQLAVLGGLLAYGILSLDFDVTARQVAVTFATAVAVQFAGTRLVRGGALDPTSAVITGCSLSLLFRANALPLAAGAAAVAIGSKFVLRWRGKHLFNPANAGIVAMLLLTDGAWVSPGQWGNVALFAFLMGGLGVVVVTRAARADVTLAFLACYAGLMFGRAWWLGDPATIPLHRLQSGALLLFAFFMISDPRTTPDSRAGRIVFAVAVASIAWYIQFRLFRTNGLMWALALATPLVPLLDAWLPGARYAWRHPTTGREPARRPAAPLSGPTLSNTLG